MTENTPAAPQIADEDISRTIVALCNDRGEGKTICPTDAAQGAAREAGGDALAWRDLIGRVRRVAVRLAKAGTIVIYRKGKPVDPDDFRGVYRLGLPHQS